MSRQNCWAKVNIKVLVTLVAALTAGVGVLAIARQVCRQRYAAESLALGQAAFETKDWPTAVQRFEAYLRQNPDDLEILRKYSAAALSVRPLDPSLVSNILSACRRIVRLDPLDLAARERLVLLCAATGRYEEVASVARARLAVDPADRKATLWLADALIHSGKSAEAQQMIQTFLDGLDARPERHVEYVQACVRMSSLARGESSTPAETVTGGKDPNSSLTPLKWLDRAVNYAPDSVEAHAHRAQLYRRMAEASRQKAQDPATLLELARKDLEAADTVGTDDPLLRCFLGAEWMALGDLERASLELRTADQLRQDVLADRLLSRDDWTAAKFLLDSDLAMRKGEAAQAVSLADRTLAALTEKQRRIQVLPFAIPLYVAAGKVVEARRCLDEYLDLQSARKQSPEPPAELPWLKALVARAENRPQAVIDALQSVALTETSAREPPPWRLLVEAYHQTNQSGRAVSLLLEGLRRRPYDPQMREQLAKEYLARGYWDKARAAAELAEALNPANVTLKLIRIEACVSLAVEPTNRVDTPELKKLGDELDRLHQSYPDQVEIRILESIIADRLGQPEEAERELKLATEQCREPHKAQMQLARHYHTLGRTVEGIGVCRRLCEQQPNAVEPWLALADLHVSNGDPNASRGVLEQALKAVVGTPTQYLVSTRIALLDLAQGHRPEGIRLLRELAASNPQDIRTRLLLLGIREVRADPVAVQRLIAELRQTEGETGLWWRLHQAQAGLMSEDWRSKQQDITNLLQYCSNTDPTWSAPVLLLADLYQKLGDSKQVEDICRKGLAQNPAATEIADRLLTLLERQNRFAEADKLLRQVEMTPAQASAWQIRIAAGAGDFSRALDELQLKVSNDDRDATSRIQLARLLYQTTKNAEQAFRYLKEAEDIAPGSRAVAAVRASILEAQGRRTEALQVLNDYVKAQGDFDAYWIRAAYLAKTGALEQAEADYQRLTLFAQNGAAGYDLLSGFYASSHRLDQAVATAEKGLRSYPDDLRLRRSLMRLLFVRAGAQDREEGLRILTELETRQPQDVELATIRAFQMLTSQSVSSFGGIKARLEDAIQQEPTAINAHLALIALAMKGREYKAACEYAVRALESNPNDPSLLAARSHAELVLGYTPTAVKLAQAALERDPNNVEALNVLVAGAAASDDLQLLRAAGALIDSAVGRHAKNEELLLAKARVLAALELPQEARAVLQTYCQTPEGRVSVAALVTLADLCRRAGDIEGAGSWIEQAQQLGTGSQAVVHARCLWLLSQNRLEELTDIGSAYLSARDQDLTTLLTAASRLAASHSPRLLHESVKLLTHAVELSPTSLEARVSLASALYQTGEGERAKKIYQELRQRYPDNVRVLNNLAWILQEQDHQYESALELANRGLHLAPEDIHLLDTRATILANLPNRLADARTDLARLAQLLPARTREKAQVLLRLGRVCLRLNDPAQAKQHLQDAREIDREITVFTDAERREIMEALQ